MRSYAPYDDARDALDALEQHIEHTIAVLCRHRHMYDGDLRSYAVSTLRRHITWLRALRVCRIQAAYGREYP